MADRVSRRGKRKTVQFRGMFVWIIVFYFYNIFLPTCIFNNRLQTLFIDQLDRSKATCSFKLFVFCPTASQKKTQESLLLRHVIEAFNFHSMYVKCMTSPSGHHLCGSWSNSKPIKNPSSRFVK